MMNYSDNSMSNCSKVLTNEKFSKESVTKVIFDWLQAKNLYMGLNYWHYIQFDDDIAGQKVF